MSILLRRIPDAQLATATPDESVIKLQHYLNVVLGSNLPDKMGNGFGTWGIFDSIVEENVKNFQKIKGLKVDGIVGNNTMTALWEDKNRAFGMIEANRVKNKANFMKKVKCDLITKGADTLLLRADVASYFEKAYAEVKTLGGALTTAGGLRNLNAEVSAGRIPTSYHYPAIAFDLATTDGMDKPKEDLYVIKMGKDGYWDVYMRCDISRSTNSSAFSRIFAGKELTIANPATNKLRRGTKKPVTGLFVNLTELLGRYGFRPVRPQRKFFDGGTSMGAEWWHFQHELFLMPDWSNFQNELSLIYTDDTLANPNLTSPAFRAAYTQRIHYFQQTW